MSVGKCVKCGFDLKEDWGILICQGCGDTLLRIYELLKVLDRKDARIKELEEALADNIKTLGCQNLSETYEGQWQECGYCSICVSEKILSTSRKGEV